MNQYHASITTQTASVTGNRYWVGALSAPGRESSVVATSGRVVVVMAQAITVVLQHYSVIIVFA